jgi:hypothetical protein
MISRNQALHQKVSTGNQAWTLLSIVKHHLLTMSISLETLKGFKLDRVLSESELNLPLIPWTEAD